MKYKLALFGLVVGGGLVLLIWSNGQMRPGAAIPVVAQAGKVTLLTPPTFARGTMTVVVDTKGTATNSPLP